MSYARRTYEYERIGNTNNFQEFQNGSNDEAICRIFGYTRSKTITILYHLFSLLLLGIPYFIIKLSPKLETVKYRKCSLASATILLVRDNHGNRNFIDIKYEKINLPTFALGLVDVRYFIYQHTKFVWVPDIEGFATLDALIPFRTVDEYLNDVTGLFEPDYRNILLLYGPNKIEVEVKSYWRLFIEEVFNPFYLFQAFSVILWFFDDYISYALCVIFLTLFSSITSLLQTRKQSEALHDLVESSKCHEVRVLRRNIHSEQAIQTIDPSELVPDDLIVLPAANYVMPCDAVLLTGLCIVNESVLTGESVPVTKTALHSSTERYHPDSHKRQTLFSGTLVIQTRNYGGDRVLARVVRTGFDTTKGALVKSILFPTPIGLKFYRDSFKFLLVLFTVAAAGMSYCLYLYISRGAEIKDITIRALDIITIVVPAALPAAMAVGIVYSQNRLKKLGIYCISPPRINVCGKIKLACFDKTGTLTHDGLDMNYVVPCVNSEFFDPVTNITGLDENSPFVHAMATCHSLTRIGGELNGDPLDLNMFNFTEWKLEEPGAENARFDMLAPTSVMPVRNNLQEPEIPYHIGILRQFPFSSRLQCMSVICRDLSLPYMVAFTKGAPEKIQSMCLPYTIPGNFNATLSQYTARGFRVIALAYKDLPSKFSWREAQKCKRDIVECDLIFLGLLVMQNPLKEETAPVIRTLHKANIRTVMITGDNILTAISVARECAMLKTYEKIFVLSTENCDDHNEVPKLILERVEPTNDDVAIDIETTNCRFAIDGRTWNKLKCYYPDLLPRLLIRTTIFARFQPDQKTQLVTHLQSLDYIVSMVGDGANDCGALKAAHVGVSLSQAEASVAAPFTSTIPDISCIMHLMLEGRCALVTSFAIFKYMALYSLIQFFTILILYRHHSILGDHQFLFIDLIITTCLAVTIGRQGPSRKLHPKRPMSSLVAAKNVIPLMLQIAVCALIQIGSLVYLFQQKWFKPIPDRAVEEVILSWENTVIFTVSCYQYIILATVYSKGRPYREMLITNFWFLLCALSLTVFVTWIMVLPWKKLAELMEIIPPTHAQDQNFFRLTLLAFPITHFILAVLIEVGIADREWLKKCIQCMTCKKNPKNKYKLLLQENDSDFWAHIDSYRVR